MPSPLSPSTEASLNIATPPATQPRDEDQVSSNTSETPCPHGKMAASDDPRPTISSQTSEESNPAVRSPENTSPSKVRHSRILSGTEIAPLKILINRDENVDPEIRSPSRQNDGSRSPRKQRFPVKITHEPPQEKAVVEEREIAIEDALKQNKDLAQAIQIFEDDESLINDVGAAADLTSLSLEQDGVEEEEPAGVDDTMVSAFSNFSAVPNMTTFARIGHSPTRFANMGATPTARARAGQSPQRASRPHTIRESGGSTNLLDFTEQIQGCPPRYSRQSPNKMLHSTVAATPQRRKSHLLDFDIPPLPTPRSIPTITPRELESLKSAFHSEISSLKASLDGKDAEVSSLKTSVNEAEKRAGKYAEELREIRVMKDSLTEEKESWEKRGREMETVLRSVKEEMMESQHEREELESKLDESEKRREAAEIMAQEAETKMAGLRAGKRTSDTDAQKSPEKGMTTSREVEIAVERASRELHSLYKEKHEAKVAALKKSYENRWQRKISELECRVQDMAAENEKLKRGREATMTRFDPNQSIIDEERKEQLVENSTQINKLNAEMKKLEAVIGSVKKDNQDLRQLLEKERVEKGELVQLAEEMMSMQSVVQTEEKPTPRKMGPPPTPKAQTATKTTETTRNGLNRGSGLRAPGSIKKKAPESRIGGPATERKIGGGLPRPGSGLGSRSGIMSSIEKMGNYRGRAE
ncbi:hypothetical protein F5Y15DRAFT_363654 [Xylariaceae sp. FL0016]|nr:hypothetical protein F5Y15DRAFT_363654 [Xylariaceae sp. FL0016]